MPTAAPHQVISDSGATSRRADKGDWIIIQFGHNDKTDTDATVEANLTPM